MNKELLKSYIEKYPDCDVNDDGIINESLYSKETIRPLFLLKETNTLAGPLIDFLAKGAPDGGAKTWQPISKWTEALLYGTMNCDYSTTEERKQILNRIATLNLKKTAGAATSGNSYIKFARENKELILQQLSEIPCNIIILCCNEAGNKFIQNKLIGITQFITIKGCDLKYGYLKDGNLVIQARHPNRSPFHYVDSFLYVHNLITGGKIILKK